MKIAEKIKQLVEPSTPQYEVALEATNLNLRKAVEACNLAEAQYQADLQEPDINLALCSNERLIKAKVGLDHAKAQVRTATERLSSARARDEAARIRKAYEAAQAEVAAAAALLQKEFEPTCNRLVDIMHTLMRADATVRAVNAALPEGAEPLISPEALVRNRPAITRKILKETFVERWVSDWDLRFIPEASIRRIISDGKGGHLLQGQNNSSGGEPVSKRKFKEIEYIPEQREIAPEPLAATIVLPSLTAGGTYCWQRLEFFGAITLADFEAALEALEKARANQKANEPPSRKDYELIC